ncbi:MAG TPA: PhzF family phenazine biosynthesis protein [Longimicrobiaceae bacterium]|nr:PhzF family phenazine biosynthesis protein [Longimicrobiaceae bacterium]
MELRYHTLDVFTDRVFGGNPLAVFPDGRGVDPERMQRIAREMNLSETVFVLPPDDPAHTRRLRIFNPVYELPFAGHPTVGTAFLLAALGEVPLGPDGAEVVFEEGVGPVRVRIEAQGGRPASAQLTAARVPERGPPPPTREELAALLGLAEDELPEGEWTAEGWSAGVPFLFVPVRGREALRRARVDPARWEALLAGWWAPHLYVLARDPELPGSDVRARMFAPAMGIVEDPATGAAASALAGYLAARAPEREGTLRWTVEQGWEMGRPSLLRVEAELRGGAVAEVRVGGAAVLVAEGVMRIPGGEP